MDLAKWDPNKEIAKLRHEMRRFFGGGNGSDLLQLEAWTPEADIFEDDKAITIKLEVPEVEKKDISVEIEGDTLTIHGERRLEQEEKRENYQRIERSYGTFARSFYLPDYIDREKIEAEDKNGVLRLTLPKVKAAKPTPVKVTVK